MTPSPDPVDFAAEDAGYVRNAAVMTVGTALSRVTGFLRLSAQVAAIGVTGSALADTYTTANTTPNILYELALGGILTSVFVPLFVDWMQQHGRVASWEVADRVLTLTLVVLSAIAVLGIVFAPQIIGLYNSLSEAPDQAAQLALGTFFLRWFMPQIVFYGIGAVAGGLLNANRRFAAPMFTPVLNNLVVIATFGVYAWILHGGSPTSVADVTGTQKLVLAAGTTLGVVAMTVALWPSLRAVGYRWHLRFDWNHPALRRLARLAGWVVVYVAANQLAYLVIIVLNRQVQGGITAYAAAFIVFSLPHAIFAVSIFTALLPAMSAAWSDRNVDDVRMLFSRGIRDTAVVIVPAAFGFIAIALPIIRLLVPARRVARERRHPDRRHPARLRRRPPVLLDVPAADPDLLLDAGHPDPRARERGRRRRERGRGPRVLLRPRPRDPGARARARHLVRGGHRRVARDRARAPGRARRRADRHHDREGRAARRARRRSPHGP